MKALILNSGLGSRMGDLTKSDPKCLTKISDNDTILSRQLKMLLCYGIVDVVITTGYQKEKIVDYCNSLNLPLNIQFVNNDKYDNTNYIYSVYCAKDLLDDDIIFMHGDLVFDVQVFEQIYHNTESCMVVSTTKAVPEKDFKATLVDGKIKNITVINNNKSIFAQPLYKLYKKDWNIWLDSIVSFCQDGNINVYAEDAFNCLDGQCLLYPVDIKDLFCYEIDNLNDLEFVKKYIDDCFSKKVYLSFSTDIIHGGHIAIINKAKFLGKVIIGVLTDNVVASYKRFPLVSQNDRKMMFENISGIFDVVYQDTLSYKNNILQYKPDIVVHGNDWISGVQKTIRTEVIDLLKSYNGELVEFNYSNKQEYVDVDNRIHNSLSLPDIRRSRLKKIIDLKNLVTALEAHSGITGLIVEKTYIEQDGGIKQFDAMWISSLCDSTAKGKPDIELVDMTSRFRTIEDIMEVTTKPIIFDGDTGGLTEHFVYTVRTLERMGVSMVIIEDKTGLKKNSLFGTDVVQTQDSVENFCNKIRAGKNAQKTKDFMICARIESLILEKGIVDAIDRAKAYVDAGADAIMIHSRKKEPDEIFEFITKFRDINKYTPIVLVPTSFNSVYEEEFKKRGANIIIYANHLTRAGFPAMKNVAEMILKNHRAKECDEFCMPIKDIITLIPDDI